MAGVFVTGGTGLVGGGVVNRLVASGRRVVGLARGPEGASLLEGLGAEPVQGDVLDTDGLRAAMAGCDAVYHIAGVNAFCVADPSEMFLVNIEGSRRVVRAAAEAGVGRVVYTSSAAVLGEAHGTVGTEDSPHRGSFLSNYERSKHEAERAVFAAAEKTGVDVVSVNPSSVQGPGRSGGTGRLLLDYVNGRLKAVVDTRLSIVDIDDCAAGHLLAEANGKAGQRYILNGVTMTLREGIDLLGQVTGVDYPVRTLPGPVALAGAAAFEGVQRARRNHPKFCREMIRTMLHGHAYDGSKAARELGLAYTPVENTLRRTVEWFVAQGLVTRPLPGLDLA